jgi:hypothetical protein
MIFRVTLSNPTLGSLILTKQPKGLAEVFPTIKRGENHGLTTEIDVKLEFFCGGAGKEFIDQVQLEQGIDAEILIDIDAFCGCVPDVEAPDYSIDYSDDYGSIISGGCDDDFETFYEGQLEMQTWTTDDVFTKVNIKPRGILETVKNRLDTKVDLYAEETLDGTPLDTWEFGAEHEITMHSQEIIYVSEFNFVEDENSYTGVPAGWTQEGTYVHQISVEGDPFDGYREIELSYSQTLIPETPITNEVLNYEGDVSSLIIDGDFPATDQPLTADVIITTINTGSDTYNISGQIKFGYNLYIQVTDSTIPLTRTFEYTITPKLYLKTGSTVTLLQTGATVTNTVNFLTGLGSVQIIQAFTTEDFLFDEQDITIADDQPIIIYVKFDEQWTIQRPGLNPLDTFDLDVTKSCFVHPTYAGYENSEILITQESITENTTSRAFAIFEAGAQIARVITDQNDSFRSNIFGRTNSEPYSYDENGCGSYTGISNGFMVRGYPTTGDNARTIRMSMNDYFLGLNPIWNLGMGIEKVGDDYFIVVDSKDYFYDASTTIMTIDNIPNLKRSEAPEYYYSQINAGYELWETEFTNGLDEFNSKRQFNTGIKAVGNNLDLISSLVAAGYRIERARRNRYTDTFSEDSEDDEDNYILCLARDVYGYGGQPSLSEEELDENFSNIENINSPATTRNLRISPMRNILRHSNIINSGLTKYPAREIKFTSGEGNYKMTSEFNGDVCPGNWNNNEITENENFEWDDADNTDQTPIWLPEIIEFQYPLTLAQFKTIEANPKGVFNVSESDSDHIKGFILELKYKPSEVSEFKLLRAYV